MRPSIIFIVGALALLLAACERDIDGRTDAMKIADDRRYNERQDADIAERKASADNCLKRGGIIVRSSWDGRIVDCK